MFRKLRHPSHATVVAYLALFVALGGTALAGTGLGIPPHSITSRYLAPGSVRSSDLAKNAVTSKTLAANVRALLNKIDGSKILDGSIPAGKLGDASVTVGNLDKGSVVNADLGSDTIAGVRGWQIVKATSATAALPDQGEEARCPSGTQVLGGGINPTVKSGLPWLNAPEFVLDSFPQLFANGDSGWDGEMVWADGVQEPWAVTVWAICGETHPRDYLTAP